MKPLKWEIVPLGALKKLYIPEITLDTVASTLLLIIEKMRKMGGLMKERNNVKEIALENRKEINLILTAYQGLFLLLGVLIIFRF